jgi:hypothetical protein
MLRVLDQQRLFVTAAADGLSRWIALNVRGNQQPQLFRIE